MMSVNWNLPNISTNQKTLRHEVSNTERAERSSYKIAWITHLGRLPLGLDK